MNAPINPIASEPTNPPVAAPSSADPTTAGNIAASNAPALSLSDKIGSLEELKTRAPKVWNAILKGIASSIIHDMNKHNEHLKEALRKARENG